MKKLKEIAEFVTQRRLKKIELFDEVYLADEQNKLNELLIWPKRLDYSVRIKSLLKPSIMQISLR